MQDQNLFNTFSSNEPKKPSPNHPSWKQISHDATIKERQRLQASVKTLLIISVVIFLILLALLLYLFVPFGARQKTPYEINLATIISLFIVPIPLIINYILVGVTRTRIKKCEQKRIVIPKAVKIINLGLFLQLPILLIIFGILAH